MPNGLDNDRLMIQELGESRRAVMVAPVSRGRRYPRASDARASAYLILDNVTHSTHDLTTRERTRYTCAWLSNDTKIESKEFVVHHWWERVCAAASKQAIDHVLRNSLSRILNLTNNTTQIRLIYLN